MSIKKEIERLKKEKNAIILAHNYQRPEVQDVADFIGDSLELSMKAKETDADIIVFCGVDFMAETAKILNPDKKVLHPEYRAQCPMAAMLEEEMIKKAKEMYRDAKVVLYVNTTARCKALADSICTSANAVDIVKKIDSDTVIFGPDVNLAYYVKKRTGKKIIPVPEHGFCMVHIKFTREDIERAKKKYPKAKLLVHPECVPEVQEEADLIASTGGMVKNACLHEEWVVFTEKEMCYRLGKLYPEKRFYPAREDAVCVNMKKITIEKVLRSLKEEIYEVNIPEKIMKSAKRAIERMFELMRK